MIYQVLGWIGNACFFSRFLVQWFVSERAKESVAPPVFWWLSLVGTASLGVYAASQRTFVLLIGYALNGLIYVRNLAFQRGASKALSTAVATSLALLVAALLVLAAIYELKHREDPSLTWVVVAAIGQSLWSARFVVQWWASEREGRSHFPRTFWWLSLAGNALLLGYAIHLRDAVFIAGYVPGPIVQVRNLMLGRAGAAERA